MEIIDIHAHTKLDDSSFDEPEKIIRPAENCGIGHVCLLGDVLRFGFEPSEAQVRRINNQTIAFVKERPDFFYGFCFLSPKHPASFLRREAARCARHPNFRGIKLEAAVRASDRRVDKVMRIASEMNLAVMHHSWNTEIVNNRRRQSDPEDIACLAARFPGVKIIMAHVTSATERGVLAVREFKNVLADTSGGQPFSGCLEYAVKKLGPKRVLFGSDVPGRDFPPQLGKILGSVIPEHAKRLILAENAKKLLGMP